MQYASVSPGEGSRDCSARQPCIGISALLLLQVLSKQRSPPPLRTPGQAVCSRADAVPIWQLRPVDVRGMVVARLSFLSLGSSSPVQILPRSKPTSSGEELSQEAPHKHPKVSLSQSSLPRPGPHVRQWCVPARIQTPLVPCTQLNIHRAQLMLSPHPQQTLNFYFLLGYSQLSMVVIV